MLTVPIWQKGNLRLSFHEFLKPAGGPDRVQTHLPLSKTCGLHAEWPHLPLSSHLVFEIQAQGDFPGTTAVVYSR